MGIFFNAQKTFFLPCKSLLWEHRALLTVVCDLVPGSHIPELSTFPVWSHNGMPGSNTPIEVKLGVLLHNSLQKKSNMYLCHIWILSNEKQWAIMLITNRNQKSIQDQTVTYSYWQYLLSLKHWPQTWH